MSDHEQLVDKIAEAIHRDTCQAWNAPCLGPSPQDRSAARAALRVVIAEGDGPDELLRELDA